VVKKAMEGCEIVFHCAYGNTGSPAQQREVNVNGTENVLKAARDYNVKRVVHISTISVYGKTADGDLDESAPRKYSKDTYADSKLDAEKLAFHYFKKYGLPVSIIQPTVVYGPFAPAWTLGPRNQLKAGRVIMVEGGSGLCNAVYIDEVIQAMLLAATKEEAVGHAFLISSKEPVTWRDFYGAYEQMLGVKSTISMSLDEIKDFNRRYKREHRTINQVRKALREHPSILHGVLQLPAVNKLYQIGGKMLPDPLWNSIKDAFVTKNEDKARHILEKPILPMTNSQIDFYCTRANVKIDKAKRLLMYQPNYNLEQGMELTEEWLRFANLI
jgi:nucleoside-diphosphate-sugar epimerase